MSARKFNLSWLILLVCSLAAVAPAAAEAPAIPYLVYQGVDSAACQNPANPVVAENCQPGTDEWITRNYQPDIEIYASKTSANVGESIDLLVDTTAPTFDLYIYRNGYYGGLGGRLLQSETGLKGVQQPDCARAEDTGLRTCSHWTPSYTLSIPDDWVSGIYIIRVKRPDTGGENDTVFVVRQDDRPSQILYQQSVSTFQAYNNYGGKSVYNWNSGTCNTLAGVPRAVKVAFNRPYGQGNTDPNYYYRAEYPMVRWLEQEGYDVAYSTSLDTHNSGKPGEKNRLLDHPVFLSVGHDEYWTQEMRDAITAARDAGVHLAFFTANTGYWRVRLEDDPISKAPESVMAVYKSTEGTPPDPSGSPTGTWRDPQGANNPENNLMGVMYIGDNDKFYFPLRISAEQAQDPLYRHTGLQNMPPGSVIDIGDQIVGWEWDATVENGQTPAGLTVLASSPVYGLLLQDAGNFQNANLGQAAAQTVRYTAPSGAVVFASGTIQWSWGLGSQGIEPVETNPYIAQITYNLLADMGAQPASPTADLILDGSDTPDLALPSDAVRAADSITPPVISNIQIAVSGQSATITWDTDVEATGQVWVGERSGHIIFNQALSTDYTQAHSLTINDLQPHQTYYLKVASASREWGVAISDETSFQAGSLSLPGEISNSLKPLTQRATCWIRANTTGAIIIAACVLFVAGVAAWWTITARRQRRMNLA